MLELRALDPVADAELFKLAWSWRTPKRHVSAPQMSYSAFADNDPTQVVLGLFNGELLAIYLIREWEQGKFETHFTSRKSTPRGHVLAGARRILDWLIENGAEEVSALVRPENKPLCRFVEEVGFKRLALVSFFPCIGEMDTRTMHNKFVKYVCQGLPAEKVCHRVIRYETKDHADPTKPSP